MDEQRKSELYRQFQPKIYGYLYGKLGNRHDAEDLCADVFVKVYANIEDFDESKASLSTWIYTIARNTVFDHFRTTHASEELDEGLRDGADVEKTVCDDETLEELADALQQMPERERDLILLHYYENMTLTELAQRMGVSYSYIKIIHKNALNRLKNLIH